MGKKVIFRRRTSDKILVIVVDFVCSIKPSRRFSGQAKCTVQVLTRFASLLFTARTSTAATASKEVTMITSTRGDGTLVFHLFAP